MLYYFQRVSNVAVLCVDLVSLKTLSGLLQPEDTLAVLSFLVSTIDSCVEACGGMRVHVGGTIYLAVFGLPIDEAVVSPLQGAPPAPSMPEAHILHHPVLRNPSSESGRKSTGFSSVFDSSGNRKLQHRFSFDSRCNSNSFTESPKRCSSAPALIQGHSRGHEADGRSACGVAWQALLAADAIMTHLKSMNSEYGVAMAATFGIDFGDVSAGILGQRTVSYQVSNPRVVQINTVF